MFSQIERRYAFENDFNIVIPEVGNYLSTTELFNASAIASARWAKLKFNIFTLHNRWNYPQVIKLLGSQTRTFTIIRDPVNVFESMYSYVHLEKGGTSGYGYDIHMFVRELEKNKKNVLLNKRKFENRFGRNQISWDLGISPDIFDDPRLMGEKIQELEQQFDLVLITERLEESLILLRYLLCWPINNIRHLHLNKRKEERKSNLSEHERKVLKEWLRADYQIYDYFYQRFQQKIDEFNLINGIFYGETYSSGSVINVVEKEVVVLQEANDQLIKRCVNKTVGNDRLFGKFKETSDDIMGYVINR